MAHAPMHHLGRVRFVLRRRDLLLAGAGSAAALAAPASASAQLPAPQPSGDDEGFLQFGSVATLATRVFYREAGRIAGAGGPVRRRLARLQAGESRVFTRLSAPLGGDAPTLQDFAVELPRAATASLAGAVGFGVGLHRLRAGVLLSGAAFAEDGATRLLLARVAGHDAQAIAVLRSLRGRPGDGGLLVPIDLEQASDRLDALLATKEA